MEGDLAVGTEEGGTNRSFYRLDEDSILVFENTARSEVEATVIMTTRSSTHIPIGGYKHQVKAAFDFVQLGLRSPAELLKS